MTFKDFLLNKVVFEIRYPQGYQFWDKGGALLYKIEQEIKDLIGEKRNQDEYLLRNSKLKLAVTYGWNKLWIEQVGVENLNQLKRHSDLLWKIISENLQIPKISRAGNRFWFVLPVKSVKEAEGVITKAKIFGPKIENCSIFGTEVITRDFTVIVKDGDIESRVACGSASRNPNPELDKDAEFIKYNPLNTVLVDIDIRVTNNLLVNKFVPSDFIQASIKKIENNLVELLK